tara:strand:- start:529 stop:1350 length:822 start_codon:yes stop_codon:yes gene_type:complete
MPTIKNLKTYSVKELKDEATKQKIKGRAGLGKTDLIKLMMKSKSKFKHLTGKGTTAPAPPKTKTIGAVQGPENFKLTPEKRAAYLKKAADEKNKNNTRIMMAAEKARTRPKIGGYSPSISTMPSGSLAEADRRARDIGEARATARASAVNIDDFAGQRTTGGGQRSTVMIHLRPIPSAFRRTWRMPIGTERGWITGRQATGWMDALNLDQLETAASWWHSVVRGELGMIDITFGRQASRSRDIYLREYNTRSGLSSFPNNRSIVPNDEEDLDF